MYPGFCLEQLNRECVITWHQKHRKNRHFWGKGDSFLQTHACVFRDTDVDVEIK